MSFTVNNFVSTLVAGANSGSATISVASGHTVVVIIQERNFTGLATGTLTDSAGNTYSVGKSVTGRGAYVATAFYSIGIASPITSVTYTTGTSGTNAFLIYVWDITATGTISFADAQSVIGASVTGTDGITTGSMTITGSDALILAAMKEWGSASVSAGTSFTADSSVETFGEHRAVTASAAATFTDSVAANDYGAAGLALQIASAAPAAPAYWSPIRPLNPPGASPGKFGRFYQSPKSYAVAANVTAALTGQGATFAAGALTPNTSVAVTGQPATFSAGAITPATSVALAGQVATLAAGTLSPVTSVALTGSAATFAAGLLTPSSTVALTGQGASFAAGTLLPSSSVAITGQSASFAAGTLTPALSHALTGIQITTAAGTLSPSTAVALTGQVATFSAGTMTTGSDVTASLTGQSLSTSAGSVFAASQIGVTGQPVSSSAGTLSFSASLALVGQPGAFAPGTLVQSNSAALTGRLATFASGVMLVPGGNVTLSLTGQACACIAGAMTAVSGAVRLAIDLRGSDYGMAREMHYPDFEQDPDTTVDYPFGWGPDLEGDTIATSIFLLPDGMTQVSASQTDTTTVVFLSNPICGRIHRCTNRITTVGGRSFDKTIHILGRQQ